MTDAVYKSQQCDRPAWSLEQVLQDAYNSEISLNVLIDWIWDAGVTVRLAVDNPEIGCTEQAQVKTEVMRNTVSECAMEIVKMLCTLCPSSEFAKKYKGLPPRQVG